MLGSRNGSASCFRRGSRNAEMSAGSLSPRFKRHWARSGGRLRVRASWAARRGFGGERNQWCFIRGVRVDKASSFKLQASSFKLQEYAKIQAPLGQNLNDK